jgi:hypothetical protein
LFRTTLPPLARTELNAPALTPPLVLGVDRRPQRNEDSQLVTYLTLTLVFGYNAAMSQTLGINYLLTSVSVRRVAVSVAVWCLGWGGVGGYWEGQQKSK